MQKAIGFLMLGALLLHIVGGCSRNNKSAGEFQEYVDNGKPLKDPQSPHKTAEDSEKTATGSRKSAKTAHNAETKPALRGEPVAALKPRATLQTGMLAAFGFAGRSLWDGSWPMRGEWWLGPAVGPAPTLATIRQVVQSGSRKNRPGERKGVPPGQTAVSRIQPATTAEPRKVHLLIKEKTFRVEGPEGALRITYDDIDLLKVLNMEPVTPDAPRLMPAWLKNLNGRRVRIRGFMSPSFQQTGLRGFLLGRDNKACCFPGRAKVYDLFPVKMRDGHTTHYIQNRPFDVVGIFQIKPWIEDGQVLRLYQIVDAVVIE